MAIVGGDPAEHDGWRLGGSGGHAGGFAGCAAAGPVRWPSGAAAGPRANCGASGAAVATAGSAVAARTSPHRPRAATSTVITRAHFGFILAIAAVGLLAQATTLLVSLIEATATAATLALAGRKFGRPRDAGRPPRADL